MGTTSRVQPSQIRNKMKREEVFHKLKSEKRRSKLKARMATKKDEELNPELKEERLKKNVPKTLDNTREFDETVVGDDDEVLKEEEIDEFASYFRDGIQPNILVTTSRRPAKAVYEFSNELCDVFPNCTFVKRGSTEEVKKLVQLAIQRDYTDLIIINEDKKVPNALTLVHLPHGPTAYFRLTSIRLSADIANHGRSTPHKPELILNNFNTRLGHTVGRMFAALFPTVPEFKGRQVATLHNQRDFIFFRRHRYIFKDGKKVDLQELGPRFTLKLRWLQKGTFDTKFGEYEWKHKPEMDTSRKRFFL
ncbi:Ribosome production factor 1 [Gonapodya sp. JEL0774]|nr:Ribosome production factor 1 [Gonapodya sp. JEL0774]